MKKECDHNKIPLWGFYCARVICIIFFYRSKVYYHALKT